MEDNAFKDRQIFLDKSRGWKLLAWYIGAFIVAGGFGLWAAIQIPGG